MSNFHKFNPLQTQYNVKLNTSSCNYTKQQIQHNFSIKKPFIFEVEGIPKILNGK